MLDSVSQARVAAENALFQVADALFVINLPSRADRRREIDQQLGRIGLSLRHPRVTLFPAVRPSDKGGFPDIGSHGCFMSHLGVLRAAAAAGLDAIIVCEDDLDLARDFNARLPGVIAALRDLPWDIVYGGYGPTPSGVAIAGHPDLWVVPPDEAILCTHFLIFRGRAIRALPEYLTRMLDRPEGDPAGGPMHVDGAISWFRREHPESVTLAFVPALGHQRPSRTDIHALHWFDRTPVAREIVSSLRRIKRRLRG